MSADSSDVDIWQIDLAQPAEFVARAFESLDRSERERAERFRFEHDRRRFVVCRFCVRTILGRLLNLPAAAIEFQFSQLGKPELATSLGSDLLQAGSHVG